jgi:hypothetical protein
MSSEMSKLIIKKRIARPRTGLNLRIKQLEKGAGVGCGEQASSSEEEA